MSISNLNSTKSNTVKCDNLDANDITTDTLIATTATITDVTSDTLSAINATITNLTYTNITPPISSTSGGFFSLDNTVPFTITIDPAGTWTGLLRLYWYSVPISGGVMYNLSGVTDLVSASYFKLTGTPPNNQFSLQIDITGKIPNITPFTATDVLWGQAVWTGYIPPSNHHSIGWVQSVPDLSKNLIKLNFDTSFTTNAVISMEQRFNFSCNFRVPYIH